MTVLRTESAASCILCKVNGRKLFDGLSDRRFDIEGSFGIDRCPCCGLTWLDPRPAREDIGKCHYGYFKAAYEEDGESALYDAFKPFAKLRGNLREAILCGYFGYHDIHAGHRFCLMGRLLGKLQFLRRKAAYDCDLFLPFAGERPNGIFIDVGCGTGGILKFLRRLGWDVLGVESDARAADIVERGGIQVIRSSIEDARLLPESAAYISMRHVIEHLPDPGKAIRICLEALKPGGKLIITTPNINSYSYAVFKKDCYSLDIPRHLYFFSTSTIRLLLQSFDFRKIIIKTSSFRAKLYFDQSVGIRKNGRYYHENEYPPPARGRTAFAFKEELRRMSCLDCGEEINVVAIKK